METVATAARSLLDAGLVVVNVSLKWDPTSCKKKMVPSVRGWQSLDIDTARSSLSENSNAVAIVTGPTSGARANLNGVRVVRERVFVNKCS